MITFIILLLVGKTAAVSELGFSTSTLWLIGVAIGLMGLAFTTYRFVVGYFLAGMLYWLWVEGLHWLVIAIAPRLEVTDSYVLAVALSLLPLMGLLARHSRVTRSKLAAQSQTTARLAAGQRRFILEKDTNFYQQFVRHSSVTENQ